MNAEPARFGGTVDRVSPSAELRNAVCDADYQMISGEIRASGGGGKGEYRTFMVTEMIPSEMLTARLHNTWHSTGMMTMH